jgi:TolB-like protein
MRIPLAPKVSETLRVLLERHGTVVEKAELIREVWPDTKVEEIGLARNISQLRKVLGNGTEADRYIETLPKRGYRFVGDVESDGLEDDFAANTSIRATSFGWIRQGAFAAAALSLILGFVYWQFYRPSRFLSSGAHAARIAVVPFECLSPELDCYVFPHALNDLLVANLSNFDGVQVLSPSTVHSYQRARLSLPFMARILGLDLLLEGTIQRVGDRVRVTPRLVDVHSAKLVWSLSYEYPAEPSGDAEGRAANEIGSQVGSRLGLRGRLLPPNP